MRSLVISNILVSLVTIISLISSTTSTPLPTGCNHKSHNSHWNPDNCIYGTTKDACGNDQCTKGPGEMCGGKFGRYGTCADGLMCSNCNRCQGCSFKTFKCWDDRNCIWWFSNLAHFQTVLEFLHHWLVLWS